MDSSRDADRYSPALPVWAALLALFIVLLLPYSDSFTGSFVFDDVPSIVHNPAIRSLWPPKLILPTGADGTTFTGRPLTSLTFALNYAAGGLDPIGYHVANLAIHFLCAALLWAALTLLFTSPRFGKLEAGRGRVLALVSAALWAAHPLATEAVTYTAQRAEALGALFYLATFYAGLRALGVAGTEPDGRWTFAAWATFFAGAAAKETVATAPLALLLFDWLFVAGTAGKAARRRFYLGFAAGYALLAFLMFNAGSRNATMGLETGFSPLEYFQTQLWAVTHYLRLVFWPAPLVLDYGDKIVRDPVRIAVGAAVVCSLAGFALHAVKRRNPAGFAAIFFLLALAPTSSVIPVIPTVSEHRAYLAFAAPVALMVWLAGRFFQGLRGKWRILELLAALVAYVALTNATFHRNLDYESATRLWSQTVAAAPDNARAVTNLAVALSGEGRGGEAIDLLRAQIAGKPGYAHQYVVLGNALVAAARYNEAADAYLAALKRDPGHADAHGNLGGLLVAFGKNAEALVHLEKSAQLAPSQPTTWYNIGKAADAVGDGTRAKEAFARARKLSEELDLSAEQKRAAGLGD